MAMPDRVSPLRQAADSFQQSLDRVKAAIEDRCTCTDRGPHSSVLDGHDPDCSLQNTGWLS
jgi:hypothetical protein